VEARGGARLLPRAFPDPPHALLPTHISSQKKSLDFVRLITYEHHCILVLVPHIFSAKKPKTNLLKRTSGGGGALDKNKIFHKKKKKKADFT